jgi:hypothetical protein
MTTPAITFKGPKMKNLIISLCFFTALTANANTVSVVFKSDSQVPTELQKRISSEVSKKCGPTYSNYTFTEKVTQVRLDRIDQGVTDKYFTTTLTDGGLRGHPELTVSITVESAEYSFTNGDNLEVISVSSDYGCQ